MRSTSLHLRGLALATAALTAGSLAGCDQFVEDIEGPVDRVVSDSLDTQEAVPFLITGVKEGFNDTYDALAVQAELLSDVGVFDRGVDGATFPSFNDIDDGDIQTDNNSVDGVYNALNEYRFLADDLVRRATETIEFADDPDTETVDEATTDRLEALYAGAFHGAVARYLLATYFGLEPTVGGGVITDDPDSPGPFVPSAELYDQAEALLVEAQGHAAELADDDTAYRTRLVNSLRARVALYAGDRSRAGALAAEGLRAGDPAFTGNYASTSNNNWWSQAGRGRTQVAVADRFAAYAAGGDSRVAVEEAPTVSGETRTFYRQALYTDAADRIPFATWQETALIEAEAALFAGDAAGALALVNAVRADAGLDALEALDQATLIEERDRTLFTQGHRLVDQRRFDLPFTNLDGPLAGPWRYLPITEGERNGNPNV